MKVVVSDYFPWAEGLRFGNTHLVSEFRRDGHEVCWVSQFLHLARVLRRRGDDDRAFLDAWKAGMHQGPEGVYRFTPFSFLPHINLPFFGSPWIGRRAMKWTWPSTRRTLRRAGFGEPDVLWFGVPRVASMMDVIKPRHIVYRMCDLFTDFHGQPRATEELEAEMCRRSSVVFGTSLPLVERAQRWAENVVYLPNGVDVTRFDGDLPPEPEDLAEIPRPRVLHLGALAHYVDFEVFERIARQRPDVSVVVIGPVQGAQDARRMIQDALAKLSGLPNVHLLGQRPHDTVPAYMRNCDVGMLARTPEEVNQVASPNKLFEYSAAGLPVVSRRLREAEAVASDALFYDDLDEMLECVDKAIDERDNLGAKMRAFAENSTWRARYEAVISTFQDLGILKAG